MHTSSKRTSEGEQLPNTPTEMSPTSSTNSQDEHVGMFRVDKERKVEIAESDIIRFYNAPQPVAALLLGCSLSSLYIYYFKTYKSIRKRRYYEITKKGGVPAKRWPYQSLTIKVTSALSY
jgi:hypothetical protein